MQEAPDGNATDESTAERIDIGAAFRGLQVHPLEAGSEAEWAFVLLKVRDAAGTSGWSFRTTGPPDMVELLGALTVQAARVKRDLLDEWD